MKKICIVTTVPGTLRSFVVPTAEHLYKNCGYDVTLICDKDDDFAKSLPEYIHYIPVPMERGINLSGFKAIKKFRKIFREQKFDMVQYSTPNASLYASIAAKKEKIPKRVYAQWGIRYVGLSGASRKIFKYLEKKVCKNSTNIFAVSPMNMEFSIKEGLYKGSKAKVIGKGGTIGVDMEAFDISKREDWKRAIREQYGIKDSDFLFGFVGRISADKGCKELLKAFKEVAKEHSNAKLMMVGRNESKSEELNELIAWAEQSENVVFTGRVEKERVKEYYAAFDMLVHPTYREGFGMVIQEAGALGLPVITTKIPGASEVMEDGVSCVLVKPKDVEELKQVMLDLAKDTGRAKEIGDKAYERVCKYYKRSIMLANQQKAYERIMKKENDFEKIVLTEKNLDNCDFPNDTFVKTISFSDIDNYNHSDRVVAICGSRSLSIKCMKMDFPSLKLFQLTSAGFDGVPLKEYAERNVIVANAGSVYSAPIAETVIFGILQMAKKLRKNPNNRHFKLRRGYNTITELSQKRVLIMGAGNIGTAVANRLQGFEVHIDGYDPYCKEKTQYEKIIRTKEELKANIYKYDYIISTLPDNEETRGFINKELFGFMKKTTVIVNVGRKAVFNKEDFYQALKHKKIGGAVLDMFEKLPNPITNKFRRLKNVIVLPGVSAISKEVNIRLKKHMYSNLIALLENKPVSNVINEVK